MQTKTVVQEPPAKASPAYCECERPIPQRRAERKGASRIHCARCGLPMPLRMGR